MKLENDDTTEKDTEQFDKLTVTPVEVSMKQFMINRDLSSKFLYVLKRDPPPAPPYL